MSCRHYQKYELGELEEMSFQKHARECDECRSYIRQDREVLDLAKGLNQPLEAPALWDRIELALVAEQKEPLTPAREHIPQLRLRRYQAMIVRLAAVFLVAVSAGAYFYFAFQPTPEETQLLVDSTLEKVQDKEREYLEAINELQGLASAHMEQMGAELMLLYRDKLETIEAQIVRCKEALASNPANAHIRRYLFTALKDKKETLEEILEYQSPTM